MPATAQTDVTIRRMQPSDLAVLEKLVHAAYRGGEAEVSWKNEHDIVSGPRITQAGLNALLVSDVAFVLVAERLVSHELCGCVLVEKEIDENDGSAHAPGVVVIGMLAVGPNAQNLGLGRKLVIAAEAAATETFGATRAHMHVASVRQELMEWYKRLGYLPTGKFKPFPGPEVGITPLIENLKFQVIEKVLKD